MGPHPRVGSRPWGGQARRHVRDLVRTDGHNDRHAPHRTRTPGRVRPGTRPARPHRAPPRLDAAAADDPTSRRGPVRHQGGRRGLGRGRLHPGARVGPHRRGRAEDLPQGGQQEGPATVRGRLPRGDPQAPEPAVGAARPRDALEPRGRPVGAPGPGARRRAQPGPALAARRAGRKPGHPRAGRADPHAPAHAARRPSPRSSRTSSPGGTTSGRRTRTGRTSTRRSSWPRATPPPPRATRWCTPTPATTT